jgi:hypothetical protein
LRKSAVDRVSESAPQQPAQITDRVIAVFNDYSGLLAAMRLRVQEQKIAITSPDIARVSGLADAFVAKCLSPKQPRRLGSASFGAVMSLLGVRLAMIEDPETMARYTARLKKHNPSFVHSGAVHFLVNRYELRKRGRKGGLNSRKYMSPREARALARHAALERWRKAAEKEAAAEARKAAKRKAAPQAKAA